MLVRIVGGLILAASTVDAAVIAHELLKESKAPAALSVADKLMPADAANDLRVRGADETVSDDKLRDALTKNPWDTHSWIELSVHAELRGDRAEAEKALREAAAHDIGREPRWALANYYYRQHDKQETIEWANRYRAVTHDREESLFRMVAEVEPNGAAWSDDLPHLGCDELKTAINVLEVHEHAADPLIDRMTATCRDEASNNEISQMVSGLLMKDESVRAGEIWHQMGRTATLDNASFSRPVSGEGFDWRINQSSFVGYKQSADKGLVFTLNDGVSSGTVLMFQPEILEPGRRYRLTMRAHSEPATVEAFRWELVELSSGRHIASELDEENVNEQTSWEFKAPLVSNKTLALALYYKRPEGQTPFTGKFYVEATQLSRGMTGNSREMVRTE